MGNQVCFPQLDKKGDRSDIRMIQALESQHQMLSFSRYSHDILMKQEVNDNFHSIKNKHSIYFPCFSYFGLIYLPKYG